MWVFDLTGCPQGTVHGCLDMTGCPQRMVHGKVHGNFDITGWARARCMTVLTSLDAPRIGCVGVLTSLDLKHF